jgi:bacillithiol biosynthesis cysteine-adding enzyme BshC
MSAVRVVSRALAGSPLAHLASSVPNAPFFPARPADAAAWKRRVAEIREATPNDWRARLAPALGATAMAAERLSRVAEGRGVVVTTGQQPGLFGGPLYTLAKALTALEMADVLEEETGVPVVPVFWAATDDADYAEASVAHVATRSGLSELRLPGPGRPGVPMADQPIGEVEGLIAELHAAAGSASFEDPLHLVSEAYASGGTIGRAYVSLLRGILEPLGIAVLDASHPSVKDAGRPVLVDALIRAREIDDALARREHELRAAGHEPQVAHVKDLSLVFEYGRGTKQRVPLSRAEARAKDPKALFGPNVLLRPLVERSILPTVAYASGPAELAYFAQVSAIAPILGVSTPLGVPRWSGVIIEPYVDRILDRYNLHHDDLSDVHVVARRLVAERLPATAHEALARLRDATRRGIDELRRALASQPPALVDERVLSGAEHQLAHRVDRLERRVMAAAKRREADLMTQLEAAQAALWPLGQPQERVLNWIPLLAREGPDLLTRVRQAAREHVDRLVRPSRSRGASESRPAIIST